MRPAFIVYSIAIGSLLSERTFFIFLTKGEKRLLKPIIIEGNLEDSLIPTATKSLTKSALEIFAQKQFTRGLSGFLGRNLGRIPRLDIEDSKGALVNVTGGDDMTLQEAHEVVREVHSKINKDARIIWGASIDSTLEHQIRVMLVVTGVKSSQILGPPDGVDDGMQSKYGIDFVH